MELRDGSGAAPVGGRGWTGRIVGEGSHCRGAPYPDHHGRCTVTGTQSRSQTLTTREHPHPTPPSAHPWLPLP